MPQFFVLFSPVLQRLFLAICAGMTAGFLIFVILWLAKNTRKGFLCQTFLPFRHQPPVTWSMTDVLLMMTFYFVLQTVVVSLVLAIPQQERQDTSIVQKSEAKEEIEETDVENSDGEQRLEERIVGDKKLRLEHPLVIIMRKAASRPLAVIVCFLSAIIIAPLTEEFLFRVVIQSGIASALRKNGGDMTIEKYLPILLTSLFFAVIHFREAPSDHANHPITPQQVERFVRMMGAVSLANLITMGTIIVFLRRIRQAKWSDFGFGNFRQMVVQDALGALLILLVILVPIFTLNGTMRKLFPGVVIDPIPLFFFAAILGTIYYRTRRFAVIFFLHAFFNAFSFLILLFARDL
jgi:membrane protease YdiL (CAAX protease family)